MGMSQIMLIDRPSQNCSLCCLVRMVFSDFISRMFISDAMSGKVTDDFETYINHAFKWWCRLLDFDKTLNIRWKLANLYSAANPFSQQICELTWGSDNL